MASNRDIGLMDTAKRLRKRASLLRSLIFWNGNGPGRGDFGELVTEHGFDSSALGRMSDEGIRCSIRCALANADNIERGLRRRRAM